MGTGEVRVGPSTLHSGGRDRGVELETPSSPVESKILREKAPVIHLVVQFAVY